jgi:hypothetical protein
LYRCSDVEGLTKKALDGFGDFRAEGEVTRKLKYANDLVLPAKKCLVLRGMIDRLIEIGRYYERI